LLKIEIKVCVQHISKDSLLETFQLKRTKKKFKKMQNKIAVADVQGFIGFI